jgi:dodecin
MLHGFTSVLQITEKKVMSDHTYKIIELTGSSTISIQNAIENAIARAAKTVHDMRWFEVTETRGHLDNGKIEHWQVTIKVGFTLKD